MAAATLWLGGLASIAGAIGLIVVANRGDVTLSQARAFLYTLSGVRGSLLLHIRMLKQLDKRTGHMLYRFGYYCLRNTRFAEQGD